MNTLSEADRLLPARSDTFDDDEERAFKFREKILIPSVRSDSDDSAAAPSFSWRKLWLFMGSGFLISIVFLDPGNLEGDLQAGAIAGYSLLWLLLWAMAMRLLPAAAGARGGAHQRRNKDRLLEFSRRCLKLLSAAAGSGGAATFSCWSFMVDVAILILVEMISCCQALKKQKGFAVQYLITGSSMFRTLVISFYWMVILI